MFGFKMKVGYDGFGVVLRPLKVEDMAVVVPWFSSLRILRYTSQLYPQTIESEEAWYHQVRKSATDVVWAIVPVNADSLEEDVPIGVTGLHDLNMHGGCSSGIIIWNSEWWGKGVASRAHLARTQYAVNELNRLTISSEAYVPNQASLKALLRVGYVVTGRRPRVMQRQGIFLDSHILCWFNPTQLDVLYPDGVPVEYQEGVRKAKKALQRAKEVVEYL